MIINKINTLLPDNALWTQDQIMAKDTQLLADLLGAKLRTFNQIKSKNFADNLIPFLCPVQGWREIGNLDHDKARAVAKVIYTCKNEKRKIWVAHESLPKPEVHMSNRGDFSLDDLATLADDIENTCIGQDQMKFDVIVDGVKLVIHLFNPVNEYTLRHPGTKMFFEDAAHEFMLEKNDFSKRTLIRSDSFPSYLLEGDYAPRIGGPVFMGLKTFWEYPQIDQALREQAYFRPEYSVKEIIAEVKFQFPL